MENGCMRVSEAAGGRAWKLIRGSCGGGRWLGEGDGWGRLIGL